ncbi:hypothetical protein GCM10009760_44580 [Kitasatospora kazusensis]|uniref:DUF6457 domain-containing protein n=1 Tax=Kitasatospora kazusensis TaxID=407974 RepID=A0ABN2ZZ57_9ACTN
MERTLDDWIAEVGTELGIDLDVDVRGLLDLTRVVAHGVARPAAPLTAFLIGYAAAQQGGGPAAVTAASARAAALAERWAAAAAAEAPEAAPEAAPGAAPGAGPA